MSLQNAQMLPLKAWNITRTRWFVLKANIICLDISFLTEIPRSGRLKFWHAFGNAMLCYHLQSLPAAAPHHQAELFPIRIPSIIPPGSELRPINFMSSQSSTKWEILSFHGDENQLPKIALDSVDPWWTVTMERHKELQHITERNVKSTCSSEPASSFLKWFCKQRMNCLSVFLPSQGDVANMWSLFITPQSEAAFSSPRKTPNPRAFTLLFPALPAKLNKIKLTTWLSVDSWWRAAVHQITIHHPEKRWHLEHAGVFIMYRNALSQLGTLAHPASSI